MNIELPPEGQRVLANMDEEVAFSAKTLSAYSKVPIYQVRKWQRAFVLLGLAEFGTLRDLDEGSFSGRGYWLTGKGWEAKKVASDLVLVAMKADQP